MHARKPTLFKNDAPRPEPAPAGMLQGLPIAEERRAVGWGNGGAGEARCDVDHWLRAARALTSGEEQLVPTSSRLILRLSRLMVAVPTANLVRWRAAASSGWGRALERAVTSTAASPVCGHS